ncbi:MAG TPA: hypothetical protein DCX79_21990 [Planctomycetaceae bacterium]|nr:hypothetical protein [Planctomycetaceae bacterium]
MGVFPEKRGCPCGRLPGNDDVQSGVGFVGVTRILTSITDSGVRQSVSALSENSPKKVKMPGGQVG